MCCYWEDDGRGFRQLLLVMPPSKVFPECDAVVPIRLKKWKNLFYEMKGDVGMSVHEKERKQDDAYTKTQTHS